jgi:molybdopterin/thiamine biosynthesis adenylyltransferase
MLPKSINKFEAEAFARLYRHLTKFETDELSAWAIFERLRNARILILGVGTLGTTVLQQLSGNGIGHFVLVDFDVVEMPNLSRQSIFRHDDVGRLKTDVAKDWLGGQALARSTVCSSTSVASKAAATSLLSEFAHLSCVVLTADMPRWKLALWVQGACTELGIPLIRGNSLVLALWCCPAATAAVWGAN